MSSLDLSIRKAASAQKRGDLIEAERLYDDILRRFPNNVRARQGLESLRALASSAFGGDDVEMQFARAVQLQKSGRLNDAGALYQRILELQPDHAGANHNLGGMLFKTDQMEEAIPFLERAAAAAPTSAAIQCDLGNAFQRQFRLEEAIAAYRRAILLQPDLADAYSNLGNVFQEQRRFDLALACYDRALAIDPGALKIIWNKAILSLLVGDYETGWPLYEVRKQLQGNHGARDCAQPLWTGAEDIDGKILFVHAEQGFGDMIQFIRYVPLLRERGAEVVLSLHSPLIPLLSPSLPGVRIIGRDAEPEQFHYHVPVMSLPLAFGTRLDTIPLNFPYIAADPARVVKWADRLGPAGLKIGICWQGTISQNDRGRSIPLSAFQGVAELPGVRLISLHKGGGEGQIEALAGAFPVEQLGDFDPPGAAFLDTAAVMAHCDLVITSDTVIAHLAGAMGRPVWLVSKHFPYWRWLLDREDSPWYPSMRLFRQDAPDDWRSAFAKVERALAALLADRRVAEAGSAR